MTAPPWSFIMHLAVPPASAVATDEVSVTYDRDTDTLFGNLRPLHGPTISCWVGRYKYLRIEWASRQPIGIHVEDLALAAADHDPRLLQVAAFSSDLLKPTRSGSRMLTHALRLKVVHQAVVLATRAYDRHHGIQSLRPGRSQWIEREAQLSEERLMYVVESVPGEPHRLPAAETIVDDLNSFLHVIARRPNQEQEREFERVLHYWMDQPNDQIKKETGHLLLSYIKEHQSAFRSPQAIPSWQEDLLLRKLTAG